jgi:hypothetical protein
MAGVSGEHSAEDLDAGGDQEENTPTFSIGDIMNRTSRRLIIVSRSELMAGHMSVTFEHV